jgi:hypothetical protein
VGFIGEAAVRPSPFGHDGEQRRLGAVPGVLHDEPSRDPRDDGLDAGRMAEEVRADHARVDCHGTSPSASADEPALELEGEQHVRELAVAARLISSIRPGPPVDVVEIQPPPAVGVRCDRDDSIGDEREQQARQGEVTEVVRPDLAFEPVDRASLGDHQNRRC